MGSAAGLGENLNSTARAVGSSTYVRGAILSMQSVDHSIDRVSRPDLDRNHIAITHGRSEEDVSSRWHQGYNSKKYFAQSGVYELLLCTMERSDDRFPVSTSIYLGWYLTRYHYLQITDVLGFREWFASFLSCC